MEPREPGRREHRTEARRIAAVDLGSNGFRLARARVEDGVPEIELRRRDPVRLAGGLDGRGRISAEVRIRALRSLEGFAGLLRDLPDASVRAAGTNTFRAARADPRFHAEAEAALGRRIEILSGREEGRLIFLGVAHDLPGAPGNRLVLDIGGGSTELVIGRGFEVFRVESVGLGCVSGMRRGFEEGLLTRNALAEARTAARKALENLRGDFEALGWSETIGASGTLRAIERILRSLGGSGGIDLDGVEELLDRCAHAGRSSSLSLPGLKPERRPVFAPGLAICAALFDVFRLETIRTSRAALREGLLLDLCRNRDSAGP